MLNELTGRLVLCNLSLFTLVLVVVLMVAPKLFISWGPKLPLGSQFWSMSDPQIVNNFAEHLAQIVDKFASSASPGHESSSSSAR